jgi:hypothetical protein
MSAQQFSQYLDFYEAASMYDYSDIHDVEDPNVPGEGEIEEDIYY